MITAIFPTGVNEITVSGLHQWDYGQELEIHASELPAIVEVHFSCPGMSEAVVRTCSTADGVVSARIPDICTEQTRPITAWVYEIEGTSGRTTKKITLPVIARTRPAPSDAMEPEGIDDKYTQLMTSFNERIVAAKGEMQEAVTTAKADIQQSVDAIAAGNIVVAEAVLAQKIPAGDNSSISVKYADRILYLGDATSPNPLIIPVGWLVESPGKVIGKGGTYSSLCFADFWTRVRFSITGAEYESIKFRLPAGSSSISLDKNGYFQVTRVGSGTSSFLKFSNTSSSDGYDITILKIIQYEN